MKRLAIATLLCLATFSTQAAEQIRSATPFKTIDVRGPVSLVVEVGKAPSIRVEGSPRFIERVTSEIVNGELRLGFKEKNNVNIGDGDRVIVTTPQLTAFSGEGAGQMILNKVRGERLDVDYRGAGSLQMNGRVDKLRLDAEGVGEVEARDLVAQDADVRFRGIGSVSVHAKNRLRAEVQGMGELTYYGNPRSLSKSVSGIGSVVAGR